ncbi:MAG: methionyl-tRNA formyltransferase [Thermoanaerobacteraceae bacterium]|nr:methionyl-tRNA formyltransferase [Thermoanaerobacteraceae bacterium]
MRVVFMGTPEFAATPLEMLIKEKVDVVAVVTQPDRPVGRKRIITPPPVKTVAMKYNIPIYQPVKIKDEGFIKVLASLKPDLITVVAFGQILSRRVLEIPKIGCINVHASLLPKYRGAAPIQWAIINGETVTGVTTMWMDEGLDTGDIFLQESTKINEDWTSLELFKELSTLGGNLLVKTLEYVKSGNIIREPQDNEKATYAPMLKKEIGEIDWSKNADDIYNLIRGTYPWPGAYTTRNGSVIKIFKARPYSSGKEPAPGKFRGLVKNEGFLIGTGTNDILVTELQEAGGKRMKATEYLAGHHIKEGDLFADN